LVWQGESGGVEADYLSIVRENINNLRNFYAPRPTDSGYCDNRHDRANYLRDRPFFRDRQSRQSNTNPCVHPANSNGALSVDDIYDRLKRLGSKSGGLLRKDPWAQLPNETDRDR
jgi:hypothetical protein